MISRNTTIPTAKSQIFSTAADNQTQVEINVLQGERPMAADNKSLGRFILDGIPPAPRGIPQIEVTFDLDANGILNVTAKDKATNKEQKITIQGSTGLSKEEVEKMTHEAEQHAEEDKAKKELIEAKNQADNLCFVAEKTLKDAGDKVTSEEKKEIEEEVAKVKELLKKDDITKDNIEEAIKDLQNKLQKIGEKMYQQSQTQNEKGKGKNQEQKAEEKKENKEDKGKAEEGEVIE
jgi:molecular chaperone DnaK